MHNEMLYFKNASLFYNGDGDIGHFPMIKVLPRAKYIYKEPFTPILNNPLEIYTDFQSHLILVMKKIKALTKTP